MRGVLCVFIPDIQRSQSDNVVSFFKISAYQFSGPKKSLPVWPPRSYGFTDFYFYEQTGSNTSNRSRIVIGKIASTRTGQVAGWRWKRSSFNFFLQVCFCPKYSLSLSLFLNVPSPSFLNEMSVLPFRKYIFQYEARDTIRSLVYCFNWS